MTQQRDAFISEITKIALKNKNIVFLSADFGAPALDEFREKLPEQFFHMGISEQNMIDTAIGLALCGKTVVTYAMAPFISMRCTEQHKLAAMMNLPIINVFAGVGFSYANAGPTHYSTEDLAICLSMLGSTVFTASDSALTKKIARNLLENPRLSFVRLDRNATTIDASPDIDDFDQGYRTFFTGKKALLITHGYLVSKLISQIQSTPDLNSYVTVLDLFCCTQIPEDVEKLMSSFKEVIFLDEQVKASSLGTHIVSNISSENQISTKNFHLKNEYAFENKGRDWLIENYGINIPEILKGLSLD